MKAFKLILTLVFGVFMILGGVNPFLKPEMYTPFIPDPLPKALINYGSGIIEIVWVLGFSFLGFVNKQPFGFLS